MFLKADRALSKLNFLFHLNSKRNSVIFFYYFYTKDENFKNSARREKKRLSISRLRLGFHLLCIQASFDFGHIASSESETSNLSFIRFEKGISDISTYIQ